MIIVVSVCLNRFGFSVFEVFAVGLTLVQQSSVHFLFGFGFVGGFCLYLMPISSSASPRRCTRFSGVCPFFPPPSSPPLTPPRLHFRDEFIAETMFVSQPSNRTLIKSTKRQGRKKGSKSNVSHSFNPQRRHQFDGNNNQPSNQRPTKSKAIK